MKICFQYKKAKTEDIQDESIISTQVKKTCIRQIDTINIYNPVVHYHYHNDFTWEYEWHATTSQ